MENQTEHDTNSTYDSFGEAEYHLMYPRFSAIPLADCKPINIDVTHAIVTVLGALPEIVALRSDFHVNFRDFEDELLDSLGPATLALSHAHALYRGGVAPRPELAQMATELTATRDRLYDAVALLSSFGLMSGEVLRTCKAGNGYRTVTFDVVALVAELRGNWSKISGRVPLTEQDLLAASNAARELATAIGLREQGPVMVGERSENRQKAFTLFIQIYEKLRRAVQYVRADFGDSESIAPSLYSGRTARKGKDAEAEVEPTPAPSAVSPTPMAATTPAMPTFSLSAPLSY